MATAGGSGPDRDETDRDAGPGREMDHLSLRAPGWECAVATFAHLTFVSARPTLSDSDLSSGDAERSREFCHGKELPADAYAHELPAPNGGIWNQLVLEGACSCHAASHPLSSSHLGLRRSGGGEVTVLSLVSEPLAQLIAGQGCTVEHNFYIHSGGSHAP